MIIFLLFCSASGLIFRSPSNIDGLNAPTYMVKDLSSFAFSFEPFGKNYSAVPVGSGCNGQYDPSTIAPGSVLWFIGDSLPCTLREVQENAERAQAVGLFMASAITEATALIGLDYKPFGTTTFTCATIFPGQTGDPPVGRNPGTDISVNEIVGQTLFASYYPVIFPNVSFSLTLPVGNPMWVDLAPKGQGVSNLQAIQWLGMICGVTVMALACSKWTLFFHHEGGFRLSLPQVQMIICFFGGFFIYIFAAGAAFGGGPTWLYNSDIIQFFNCWSWGAAATSAVIMGLYFREISSLTSSQGMSGLNIMKWPAIIIVIILWAALLAGGFVSAFDPAGGGAGGTSNFAFSFVIIGLFTGGALQLWGVFSLLTTMTGTSDGVRSQILRVSIVSIVVVLIMWSLGVLCACWVYFLVETAGSLSQTAIVYGVTSLHCFPTFCIFVLLMLNFRVTLQKEIEISKSGTSSTSGMSSSSGSASSSSSSGTDPVIEL